MKVKFVRAKFHLGRHDVLPLRDEKPQIRTLSNLDGGLKGNRTIIYPPNWRCRSIFAYSIRGASVRFTLIV